MTFSLTPIPTPLSDFLLNLGDLESLHNIIPAALTVYFYGRFSPWRNNLVGRALMYSQVALLVTNVVVTLSLFLGPDYWGREFVRVVGYATTGAAAWMIFHALRVVQSAPENLDLSHTESAIARLRRRRRVLRRRLATRRRQSDV